MHTYRWSQECPALERVDYNAIYFIIESTEDMYLKLFAYTQSNQWGECHHACACPHTPNIDLPVQLITQAGK